MNKRFLILILIFTFSFTNIWTQMSAKLGETYLETFRGECGLLEKSQVWDITAGNENLMFFASNYGLGVYDGVRWEVNASKENLAMRSLCFDTNSNTLYSGSVNQIGKWYEDEYGQYKYTTLWKSREKNVTVEFWRIAIPAKGYDNSLYAQSHQMILKYNLGTQVVDTIKAIKSFKYMHTVGREVWVQDDEQLYRLEQDNSLSPILKVSDRIINIIQRESDKRKLFFLEHQGMFILSDDQVELTPLNTKTNFLLSAAKIFSANRNLQYEYLVGTTKEGLFILNGQGEIIKNIGVNNDLPTSTVLCTNIDNEGNAWIGLDAGVAVLDASGKERYYSPKPLIGTVRGITIVNDILYVGTNQGLFRYAESIGFQFVPNTAGSVWALSNINGKLYFNHDLGLFKLEKNIPINIKKGGTTSLAQSLVNPIYFVGGDYYGLSLYRIENGELIFVKPIDGYVDHNRFMEFDKHGFLWILTPRIGYTRLTLSSDFEKVVDVETYALENNGYLSMSTIDNELVFNVGNRPYVYDPSLEKMKISSPLKELYSHLGLNLISLFQFDNEYWYQTDSDIGCIYKKRGVLEKNSGAFSHIYNKRINWQIEKIDATTYAVGYLNGVAFSESNQRIKNTLKVRMVEGSGLKHSVFFDLSKETINIDNKTKIINIYPTNLNPDQIIEYRVKEIDEVWSKIKIDNSLTISNLEFGGYTVQLKNAGDTDQNMIELKFDVAPPWFLSTQMILFYTLVLLSILYGIYYMEKLKSKKAQRRIERVKQAEVNKLENENLKLQEENLKLEIQEKDKRLAFITMNELKRNSFMNEIKEDIQEAKKKEISSPLKQILKQIENKINRELANEEDWEVFEEYFNIVFDGFLEKLSNTHEQLSPGDLKLLAYTKLNLNNKEIASLLNISFRSVEMAKYRLRKKLGLPPNDNFSSILNEKH